MTPSFMSPNAIFVESLQVGQMSPAQNEIGISHVKYGYNSETVRRTAKRGSISDSVVLVD